MLTTCGCPITSRHLPRSMRASVESCARMRCSGIPAKVCVGATQHDHFPIPAPDHQMLDILRHNFVSIGALFPRAAYEDAGGFRDGVSGAEDWDLWIRMIRAGLRVHGVAAPTLLYRVESTGSQPSHRYLRHVFAGPRTRGTGSRRRSAAGGRGGSPQLDEAPRALAAAYAHARANRPWKARGAALASLPRIASLRLEAALILASPSLAVENRRCRAPAAVVTTRTSSRGGRRAGSAREPRVCGGSCAPLRACRAHR